LSAQVFVHLAQDPLLLFAVLCRKSDGEIAHAHAAQARIKSIRQKAYAHAKSPCHWPRERSKKLRSQPDRQIFKPVSHSGKIWTVTSAEKYFKLAAGPATSNNSFDQANSKAKTLIALLNPCRETYKNEDRVGCDRSCPCFCSGRLQSRQARKD